METDDDLYESSRSAIALAMCPLCGKSDTQKARCRHCERFYCANDCLATHQHQELDVL